MNPTTLRVAFRLAGFALLVMLRGTLCAQPLTVQLQTDDSGYRYQSFENDPLALRIYTLENGLKVYLAPNHDEPRIRTAIVVKAGSKHDRPDATGLAHYLEHLLFKGTDRFGTTNFEKEGPVLDQIERLFEQHRQTAVATEKERIYRQIDSLSQEASQYAVSLEYNDMMLELGGGAVNAFTSYDRTGFTSSIPANQLEKWAHIEAERFRNPQFRAFHTELETVYEEMNAISDDGPRYALFQLYETIFTEHPYGHQTTIGKIEHLKNPSLTAVKQYFDTYYVPNNMAVILAGSFDPDETIQLIDAHFGSMQMKELPELDIPVEAPIEAPITKQIVAPGAEMLRMGFRFEGRNSDQAVMVKLVDMLLMNGRAGIFDININKAQKAQDVSTFVQYMNDYNVHVITATPKEGQSLEALSSLLLEEIDQLKKGHFPDWLPQAAINDFKQRFMRELDSNRGRAGLLIELFSYDLSWDERVLEFEKMEQFSKADIMAFVTDHYRDNYALVYKKEGLDESVKEIEKPLITPIEIGQGRQSAFRQAIQAMDVAPIEPKFVDYEKDITTLMLDNEVPLHAVRNTSNELFTLNLEFEMDQGNDKLLDLAVDYLEFAGTDRLTAAQIEEEFYKIGCSFSVNTNSRTTSLVVSGLSESFEDAVELAAHVLNNVEPDDAALEALRQKIFKERSDWKKSKSEITSWAAVYGIFGNESPYTNIFSTDDLNQLQPQPLVDKIRGLLNHHHEVLYYGRRAPQEVKDVLERELERNIDLIPVDEGSRFPLQENETNTIYFVPSETKQVDVIFLANLGLLDTDTIGLVYLFNRYSNDLFFRELREATGLAYSTYGYIDINYYSPHHYLLFAYVGTQSDKYVEAIAAANDLLRDMPLNAAAIEKARNATLERIRAERISKFNLLVDYNTASDRGLDRDLRAYVYEALPHITVADLQTFYEDVIKDHPMTILVVGDPNEVDLEKLAGYGTVSELEHKDVFGF